MHVEWYGQSFFRLTGAERSVVIDPHGDLSWARSQGRMFDYPAVEGLTADLVLVTHEHGDHNGIETIGGEPAVLRSTVGTLESPVGTVVAVASEHDDVAGTQRGPNTIFAFELALVEALDAGAERSEELVWWVEEVGCLGPVVHRYDKPRS